MVIPPVAQSSFWSGVVGRPCRCRAGIACILLTLISLACVEADPYSGPLNVVMIVLDAARADHIGVYGYDRDTTPFIDAFADEATRYETVISEAPFTFLAMSSLLSAGSPAVTGLVGRSGGIVPAEVKMIAETALERGFATLAYSENPYVTHYFGLDQGFEVFDEAFPVSHHLQRKELGADFDSASRLSGILDQALAQDQRPFFLYLHILRPHNPYAPPRPYAGRFGSDPARRAEGETRALIEMDLRGGRFDPDRISQLIALYDENLAYADALIGGFLAGLDTRGLRNRTIVVLTSDHGEAFGEHGRMLHSTQLFDPMLRVPLLVRVPGEPASVQSAPIQLADLGQGLLAYFQGAPDSASGLTRLGVGLAAPRLLYSWTNAKTHLVAVRTEQRKLVIDAETLEVVAYHDLDSDPGEQHPIPVDARAETLRRGLEAKIAQWVGVPLRIMTAHALDARKRRELEALGYLEPDPESGSGPDLPHLE